MKNISEFQTRVLDLSRDQIRNRINFSYPLDIPRLGRIEIKKILRGVCGKRLLCHCIQKEKEFVLKLFFDRSRAKKHWQRSHSGHFLFLNQSILTPRIRFSGHLDEHGMYAMVFDYLPQARPLDQALRQADDKEKLLGTVINRLALSHQKGIIQHDTNPGNFLVQENQVFFLDGDHVRFTPRPVKKKAAINNLALLLSTLDTTHVLSLQTQYQEYAKARQWPVAKSDLRHLRFKIGEKRMRKKWRIFLKKTGWKKFFRIEKH